MAVISGLRIYPVKSMAGLDVASARVEPWGLQGDRRWVVIDDDGVPITARTHHRLLHATPHPQPGGAIRLAAPGLESLTVTPPTGPPDVELAVSRLPTGTGAGRAADDWVSSLLDQRARLVWLDDPRRRSVGESHGGQPGDTLSLADAGPLLLTVVRSLQQLDAWMAETAAEYAEPAPDPLPMVRFRPNVVVDGTERPFEEDGWETVQLGDEVKLRHGEACDRCVLPTIDPVTLRGSKEPTRTLARHRRWDHRVHFGVRLIPVSTGVIHVCDAVLA